MWMWAVFLCYFNFISVMFFQLSKCQHFLFFYGLNWLKRLVVDLEYSLIIQWFNDYLSELVRAFILNLIITKWSLKLSHFGFNVLVTIQFHHNTIMQQTPTLTVLNQYLKYLKHILFELQNYCQYTKKIIILHLFVLHNIWRKKNAFKCPDCMCYTKTLSFNVK